ncbi:MAG: branched-chain amino acid ABC transporter substrate-binding protein [Coriobacteriia bacterium]|nr:branched-chain amino acid ABC transporter substrate-binding protein [Coriobacteriia bacterium]
MKRKLSLVLAVIAALALCFALVACNGDGGDSGDNGTATDGDVTEFIIGFGGPLTDGAVGFGQGALRATQLAVAQANASAEAQELGVQFRIVQGDDMSDPARADTVANSIISERDLVGVVGHFNSGVTEPAGAVYNEHGVVQISYGSTRVDLTDLGRENFFRTCGTDDLQGPALAETAHELGFRSVSIINDSSPYGEGLDELFREAWEGLDGTEVLFYDKYDQGENDFGPIVTAVRASDPDFLFFAGTYDALTGAGGLFTRQLREGGFDAPILGADGIQKAGFIDQAGDASDGVIATLPGLPFDATPALIDFVADYEDMFPGETPGGFDAAAFDAANVIIEAVFAQVRAEGADNVATPAGRRAIIDYIADIQTTGLSGPLSFTDTGNINDPVVTTYIVDEGSWIQHPDVDIWTR